MWIASFEQKIALNCCPVFVVLFIPLQIFRGSFRWWPPVSFRWWGSFRWWLGIISVAGIISMVGIISVAVQCVACMQSAFVWTSVKNEWNAHYVIWSRAFRPSITRSLITRVWPSVTWNLRGNLRKAQRWSNSVLTFDRCRPHFVTFGYY